MATTAKAATAGLKDVAKQVQPMVEVLAGIVLGNVAVNLANKVMKIDPTDATQKSLKKVLPPLAISAGALFGMTKVQQPMLKNILLGTSAASAAKAIKVIAPNATFLAGDDGLGLTPVAAIANDRWIYNERTPVSGMGFPDLGSVRPPDSNSGYYLDAPAYMGESEAMQQQNEYFRGGAEEQFYGEQDDLNGQGDDYANQVYGLNDDLQIL